MLAWCAKLRFCYLDTVNRCKIHYLLSADRTEPFYPMQQCRECGEYERDYIILEWIGSRCLSCTNALKYASIFRGSDIEDPDDMYQFKGKWFKEKYPNYYLEEEEPEEDN